MSYSIRLASCLAVFLLAFSACEKEPVVRPTITNPVFEVILNNEYNELQAQYAVFLSDSEGKVRAFRWLPGTDTAHLQVPDVLASDRLDCTVVKLLTVEATGSGVTDTSLNIRTYTNLASGQTIRLRPPTYLQQTNLGITFTNLTSLDTIIVPDGLTFARPQPNNDFNGFYRVLHTGKIWLRLKVNGEQNWRYMFFDNINSEALSATVDVALLPTIMDAPKSLGMPFSAAWQYKIEGVVDTASRQLLALGDLTRTPGGAARVFENMEIYEPKGQLHNGYRIAVKGTGTTANGYTYASDGFYTEVPGSLPLPSFDLEPTTASSVRFIAVKCVGNFDLLALTRSRAGNPNINWEVLMQPNMGIVTYQLPDVPTVLGKRFSALSRYDFSGGVRVRAENYERLDYSEVIQQLLRNNDPFWQAKARYLSREEVQ